MRGPGARAPRGPLRIPGALWLAAVVWSLFALLDLFVALDEFAAGRLDSEASRVASQLGRDFVAGRPMGASGVLALLAGIATAGLVIFMLTGRGWTRFTLVGLGVFASIVLAVDGRIEAFAALALLVIGAAALVTPAAHRFFGPASTDR